MCVCIYHESIYSIYSSIFLWLFQNLVLFIPLHIPFSTLFPHFHFNLTLPVPFSPINSLYHCILFFLLWTSPSLWPFSSLLTYMDIPNKTQMFEDSKLTYTKGNKNKKGLWRQEGEVVGTLEELKGRKRGDGFGQGIGYQCLQFSSINSYNKANICWENFFNY